MFVPGIDLIFSRTLFPSTEGNPRTSTETIATRTGLFSRTRARAVKSPALRVAGREGPRPPDTGSSGSGVMLRTARAARNSAGKAGNEQTVRTRAQSKARAGQGFPERAIDLSPTLFRFILN